MYLSSFYGRHEMASFLLLVTILIALWLVFAGAVMAVRPGLALWVVSKAGSTVFLQWAEHSLRFLAGVVLVLVSFNSKAPLTLLIIGGFIAASSVLILILPREWHHAYARTCAKYIPEWAVRALSPVSVIAALALIWAVI